MGLYDLPSVIVESPSVIVEQGWNRLTASIQDAAKPEVLVRLEGEFDGSSSEKLFDQLRILVADGDVNLSLDLSGVGFVSASTIGVIVQLREQSRKDNWRFNIVFPSAEVQRVFAVCGLTDLLDTKVSNTEGLKNEGLKNEDSKTDLNPGNNERRNFASGQALGSWITVRPVAARDESSEPQRSALPQVHQNSLAKSCSDDEMVMNISFFTSPQVGCGWS